MKLEDALAPELARSGPGGRLVGLAYERKGESGVITLAEAAEAEEQRRELLVRLAAGEPIELLLTAETYAQGPGVKNSNHTAFTPAALNALAKSSKGTPFSRDHSLATKDMGGLCLASKVEPAENGVRTLVEEIRLMADWAVRAALQGLMQRFSLHWSALHIDDVTCSWCEKSVLLCDHWAGDEVLTRAGEVETVTWIWKTAEWRERSWVVNPAVKQTAVREWAALSEARRARSLPTQEKRKVNEIAKMLGLAADADEQAVAEKVKELLAGRQKLEAEVEDLRATVAEGKELGARVEKLEAELAEKRQAEVKAEADRSIEELVRDGRLRAGGKQEELLRRLFKDDAKTAREMVASLADNPRIAPVGPRQSRPEHEAAVPRAGAEVPRTKEGQVDWAKLYEQVPEHLRLYAGKYAKDPERFLRSNPELLEQMGVKLPEPEATR